MLNVRKCLKHSVGREASLERETEFTVQVNDLFAEIKWLDVSTMCRKKSSGVGVGGGQWVSGLGPGHKFEANVAPVFQSRS